jgi:hypothetical protein
MEVKFSAPACKDGEKCMKASPTICCMDGDMIDQSTTYTVIASFEFKGYLYYCLSGWHRVPFLSNCFIPIIKD